MRLGASRSAPLCDVATTVASVPPYSVFSRVVQNHAGCELVALSLSVTTPELRWANAVELPPHPGATVLPAGLALTLQVLVHDGEIGIGLLTVDGKYRDEVRVGASGEAERVDIVLPAGTSLGSLLVRNTSAVGASRANIEIVGSESAPGAEKPYWMALRTVIGDTLCKRDGEVLHVTTPPAQWASAVALPPHRGATVLANGLAVNLRVLVHGGEIGIGLMAADGEYWHEVRVGGREDAQRVDIPLPAGTTLGSLLVRNTCADSASRADIELIGFEDAPDREQPYWTALRTLASGAVCIRDGGVLRVTTPEAQWASAVELSPRPGAHVLTDAVLSLRVAVHDGEVGLGLLASDGKHSHEACISANEEPERVDIPLQSGKVLGLLMVRNTSPTGRSRADIELIGCEAAPDAEQPYWTALRTVAGGALCKRVGDVLRVTTPDYQWANAIEFPPHQRAAVFQSPVSLRLSVRVYEGDAAIQVLTPDGACCSVVHVGANTEAELVEIPLPRSIPLGSLIIRNQSRTGRSKLDVEILGCIPSSVVNALGSKIKRASCGRAIQLRTIPVLTSNPRSGTHYLKHLISEALSVAPLEKDLTADPDELRAALSAEPGTHLIYGHFRYPLHGRILDDKVHPNMRLVVLTRHPLDRLISQLAYAQAPGEPVPLDLSPQQIARDLMLGRWDGKRWPDGRLYEDCVAHQIAVLRGLVTDWLENRNCHLVRFEDLISQPVDVLTGCLAFFGVSLPRKEIEKITERINFTTLSGGRSRDQADLKSHYRRGIADEWRDVFPSADLDIFKQKCGDEYKKAGYSF